MNALMLLVLSALALLVVAVVLDRVRALLTPRPEEKRHPVLAQTCIGMVAILGVLVGVPLLYTAHIDSSPRSTNTTTSPLVADSDGVFIVTLQRLDSRELLYTAPDDDGWVQQRQADFEDSVVRVGETPEVTTTTTTVHASFLWPRDTVLSESYTFTAPADGILGLMVSEED